VLNIGWRNPAGRKVARHLRPACVAFILVIFSGAAAEAQLTRLVAPGPLSRAHSALEGVDKCQKCHESAKGISVERCLSCHKPIAERLAAKKGVHKSVTDCATCHREHRGAAADLRRLDSAKFDHAAQAGYPLDGRHAAVSQKCAACHKTRSFLKAERRCSACHADPHKPTLGAQCDTCHAVASSFRDTRMQYDHSRAAFGLEGSHRRVDCAKCHVNKVYRGLKFAGCGDCHRDPHLQKFPAACASCHTVEGWRTQKVDHGKTAFPLRGKHAEAKCSACHTQSPLKAKLTAGRCTSCHKDVHRGEFKQECNACHTEQGWRGVKLDHQARTKSGYALTGKHATLACTACHKGVKPSTASGGIPKTTGTAAAVSTIDFRGLGTACVSCHADAHHAELGTSCEMCHSPATFGITSFTHPRSPEFYAGQHAGVACARCHAPQNTQAAPRPGQRLEGWKFRNVSMACASCHRDVHLGQEGVQCETCHAITGSKFAAVRFSHDQAKFALTGQHKDVPCAKCHKAETGAFPAGVGTALRLKGVPTACATCHQDRHLGQVSSRCETCHTTASFKIAAYKHADKPGFFVAKHASAKCQDCHKQQEGTFPAGRGAAVRYKGFGTSCVTCHADKHVGALGGQCAACHEASAWRVVSRAFHKTGVFPLEGRHLSVECGACHLNGVIKGAPTRCYDCHWVRRQDDRYRTRLGTNCEGCHRPMSWLAVNWNHEGGTGTRLSPVHRALGCESCHKGEDFKAQAADCTSCHQRDYQRAANPNHLSAGFPTNCDVCHRVYQSSWQQAVFNHNASFPLVGTHAAQACATCHRDGVYRGRSQDCYSCHKADYDRTQDPNHAAAGYATACDSCHRATDANFKGGVTTSHNSFLLAGVHATQVCAACHRNNVYRGTPRDCFPCHQAKYTQTTNPNHAAASFSTTCDSCHKPTDATWLLANASHTTFALVGVHATQACAACHKNNVYKGTSRDCFGCHQADYARTQSPNHAAAGFPTTCDSCHKATDATWLLAVFNHTYFPTTGRHAASCSTCHNSPTNYKVFTCLTCHDRASTDSHHVGRAGYRYDSQACYSCHPRGTAG
jgi:hypothetical protein